MVASAPAVRFGVVGLEHPHVFAMVAALLSAGAELDAVCAGAPRGPADDLVEVFGRGRVTVDEHEILDDDGIDLVVLAGVPSERAEVAVRAMRRGKDVLSDKPAVTSVEALTQLRDVHAETGRIFSVFFSERVESRAAIRAAAIVRAGHIGVITQVVGLGPHRLDLDKRPEWFFDPARAGGILCDLASHQIDQFCHLTDTTDVEITAALVANYAHPEHSQLEDYGEISLRAPRATGTARVDWYSPSGLDTWGDGRLFVLGTEGYLEVRKNCDIGGRSGGDHLFLVDSQETRYIDCQHDDLRFAGQLLADVRDRTDTAMSQTHCFAVCELAITAQRVATRRGHLASAPDD